MLNARDLPRKLWAEAMKTAVYLLNRTPNCRSSKTTPFEAWMGKKPAISLIRIFGSEAVLHIAKRKRNKLDDPGKRVIFVGYQKESTNYRVFDPVSQKILISYDVTFKEEMEKLDEISPGESVISFDLKEEHLSNDADIP